jgi:hypothetical protein
MPREKSTVPGHIIKKTITHYACTCQSNAYATFAEFEECPHHTPGREVPNCQDCQKTSDYQVQLHNGKTINVCSLCSNKRSTKKPISYDSD